MCPKLINRFLCILRIDTFWFLNQSNFNSYPNSWIYKSWGNVTVKIINWIFCRRYDILISNFFATTPKTSQQFRLNIFLLLFQQQSMKLAQYFIKTSKYLQKYYFHVLQNFLIKILFVCKISSQIWIKPSSKTIKHQKEVNCAINLSATLR